MEIDAANAVQEGRFTRADWVEIEIVDFLSTTTRQGPSVSDGILPRTRNFRSGAVNIPRETKTPGQFLDLLFNEEVLDRFVVNTNSWVRKQAKPAWTPENDITRKKLKKYFGLVLFMGVVDRPARAMYWETGVFGDDFVKSVMPRNRFDSISFSLHWLDAADVTADERKAKNKADG